MSAARLLFGLAMLVPSQAMSSCLSSWGAFLSPGPQVFDVINYEPVSEEANLVSVRYFGLDSEDLAGAYAKRYAFLLMQDDCVVAFVSLGSYPSSVGLTGSGQPRAFHLDHYTDETHATLEFYDAEPSFEEVQAIARSVLVP